MRREPGSLVKESSRNHPETVLAPPHHVLLSPYPESHRKPGCRRLAGLWAEAYAADGNGGVSQRIEYGSVGCVLPVASKGLSPSRRAGIVFGGDRRFGLPGFSKVSPRRMAARPVATMPAITSGGTMPIVSTAIIVASRAGRAGMPAWRKCRRAALPIPMPALRRALIPAARQADLVHPTSSPKRAVTSAATPRAAAACGARGS